MGSKTRWLYRSTYDRLEGYYELLKHGNAVLLVAAEDTEAIMINFGQRSKDI